MEPREGRCRGPRSGAPFPTGSAAVAGSAGASTETRGRPQRGCRRAIAAQPLLDGWLKMPQRATTRTVAADADVARPVARPNEFLRGNAEEVDLRAGSRPLGHSEPNGAGRSRSAPRRAASRRAGSCAVRMVKAGVAAAGVGPPFEERTLRLPEATTPGTPEEALPKGPSPDSGPSLLGLWGSPLLTDDPASERGPF